MVSGSTKQNIRAATRRLRAGLLLAAAIALAASAQGRDRTPVPAPSDATAPPEVTVSRVIDGDTIRLGDGRLVRYIGVDTPESRRRVQGRWIADAEPYAREATEANRALVEGKPVRLEYDVEPRDRYGRELAYVYAGSVMANEELVRLGFAQPLTIPPNVRYAERFRALAAEARAARRGLWAETRR